MPATTVWKPVPGLVCATHVTDECPIPNPEWIFEALNRVVWLMANSEKFRGHRVIEDCSIFELRIKMCRHLAEVLQYKTDDPLPQDLQGALDLDHVAALAFNALAHLHIEGRVGREDKAAETLEFKAA